MQQKKIEDASPEELRQFLQDYIGAPKPGNTKRETLEAAIREAWAPPYIFVGDAEAIEVPLSAITPASAGAPDAEDEAEDEPEVAFEPEPVIEVELKEPMVKIFVPEQQGPGGDRAIPVGVNGTALLIPRNKECEIKLRYFDALINAVETHYDPKDGESEDDVKPRDIPSYPFTVIHKPSDQEIKAWHAAQDAAERKVRERQQLEKAKLRAAAIAA